MDENTKNSANVEIYALSDPRTGKVRYIGKANNSARRLKAHIRESRRKTPLYRWIAKLSALGLKPDMSVICVSLSDEWQGLECAIISQYRESHHDLLNVADGGDEPYCADSVRSANGKQLAQRIADDPIFARVCAIKKQIGTALKLGQVPERTKAKLRECARKRPDMFGVWAAI